MLIHRVVGSVKGWGALYTLCLPEPVTSLQVEVCDPITTIRHLKKLNLHPKVVFMVCIKKALHSKQMKQFVLAVI